MKAIRPLPSVEILRELFDYDAVTGNLSWKAWRKNHVMPGTPAGTADSQGHIQVRVFGTKYFSHRIIWKMCHGVDPPLPIDHRDGNEANNALANLRLATPSQNNMNRARRVGCISPYKGVTRQMSGWIARVNANRNSFRYGPFATAEEARDAYENASREHFGEFKRATTTGEKLEQPALLTDRVQPVRRPVLRLKRSKP